MISNHIRCHPLSKKMTLFVGSILLTNIVTAHKCYVCGPNNFVDHTNIEIIPSCDRFDPKDIKFERQCPEHSKGCGIQTNGTILTRTCEKIAFNQCQVANNVEYCYCITEFCNTENIAKKQTTPMYENVDDDVYEEGSGIQIDVIKQMIQVTVLTSGHGTQRSPILYSTTPLTNSSMTSSLDHNVNYLTVFSIMFLIHGFDSDWFLS